jgi:quinol monooxygenase YgiN
MIVVAAECRMNVNHRKDFEIQMNRLSPLVRNEPGCLRYDTLQSVSDPGLFIIFEEWESQKHLDDHLARAHMKEHMAITSPWQSEPVSLSLYEVSFVDRIKI